MTQAIINYSPRRAPLTEQPFRIEAENLPMWREALAGLDWLALRASAVYRGAGVARGSGTPVVVVPGLFGTDAYLTEMRRWLGRIGYLPQKSRIGRNVECPRVMVERLIDTLESVHRATGMRVSIVGHSLGGLLARGAAILRPDLVGEVITLGSPINGVRAHPAIIAAAKRMGSTCEENCLVWMQAPLSPAVAEATIYSRTDGIVGWISSLPKNDAPAIEVRSTHLGLVFNPHAYAAIAALLDEAISRRRPAPRPPLSFAAIRQERQPRFTELVPALAG